MGDIQSHSEIEIFKHQIIDKTLLIGAIMGALIVGVALPSYTSNADMISDVVAIAVIFIVYFLRKKIGITYKSIAVLLLILSFVISDAMAYGLYAFDKVLLVVIPVYSILVYSFRKTVFIFGLAIAGFLTVGYLHITGVMITPHDLQEKSTSPNEWIEGTLIIVVVALVIVIFMDKYHKTISSLILTLEDRVTSRTKALNDANQELMSSNEELRKKQEELENTLEELRETQQQLVHSEKMASIGVLTAGITHEINNPLNIVQAGLFNLDSMTSDTAVDKPTMKLIVNQMQAGVKRASSIVKNLNAFSRKENGIELCDCNLQEVIDGCISMLIHETKHNWTIATEYENNLVIHSSEGTLQQIFMNILINSIQSAEQGEISIKTESIRNGKSVQITISDSGRGIPREILDKIFDPFFTTKEVGKGTGLGLSIVYNLVEEHGGSIRYDSTLNVGTTVTLSLPVKKRKKKKGSFA